MGLLYARPFQSYFQGQGHSLPPSLFLSGWYIWTLMAGHALCVMRAPLRAFARLAPLCDSARLCVPLRASARLNLLAPLRAFARLCAPLRDSARLSARLTAEARNESNWVQAIAGCNFFIVK